MIDQLQAIKFILYLKSSSEKLHEKIQKKLKDDSNDKLYQKLSKVEGLQKVRDDSQFGFIIEGGIDKGIFLNR